MSQDQPLISQGISRVGVNRVSLVGGISDMTPACWLCGSVGGVFKKRTVVSACLSLS